MKLNYAQYKDKVKACWIGKNIGGTLGAPYEGKKEFLNVTGFPANAKALPNDDLDLQLVWLSALERLGVNRINAEDLSEFWLSYIVPPWNEYGVCKTNAKMGLTAPLSGDYNNTWKHSNGAWIRTEIWACLHPARPDIACQYAIEDASVDHGSGEGTIAAVFVCAMQSAAFVLSTARECIDVALTKIPEDSRTYKTIQLAIKCYEEKKGLEEARNLIQQLNADIGNGWFEAPSNVGYVVLGVLYGEGDFKKSMLYAVNCADDTDCTAGTVGATLGILYGTKGLPKDWVKCIGDNIITVAINRCVIFNFPKTCTALTERICKLALSASLSGDIFPLLTSAYPRVEFGKEQSITSEEAKEKMLKCGVCAERLKDVTANSFFKDLTFVNAKVSFPEGLVIKPNESVKIKMRFTLNTEVTGNIATYLNIRWWLPDGFTISGQKSVFVPSWSGWRECPAYAYTEFTLTAGDKVDSANRIVAEVVGEGRGKVGYIPITILG